jgi:hypothetical protein
MQHADDCVHCLLSTSLTTSKALNLRIFELFFRSYRPFLVFVFLLMVTATEMPAASLGRLFKGPDAILGTSWIDSVPTGWTNASLHHLVVSSGTVRAAKSRDVYGHFRTAT